MFKFSLNFEEYKKLSKAKQEEYMFRFDGYAERISSFAILSGIYWLVSDFALFGTIFMWMFLFLVMRQAYRLNKFIKE